MIVCRKREALNLKLKCWLRTTSETTAKGKVGWIPCQSSDHHRVHQTRLHHHHQQKSTSATRNIFHLTAQNKSRWMDVDVGTGTRGRIQRREKVRPREDGNFMHKKIMKELLTHSPRYDHVFTFLSLTGIGTACTVRLRFLSLTLQVANLLISPANPSATEADQRSQAIQGSTEHLLMNALDNRAACFEKLGRHKAALRDAKRMIEILPKLSKVWWMLRTHKIWSWHGQGYLRCGKILQANGQTKLAMQIYERGLSKVKINADPGRSVSLQQLYSFSINLAWQKIQENYNKLRKAMKPESTLDPLHHLPSEVAVMVCRQLAMRDRV